MSFVNPCDDPIYRYVLFQEEIFNGQGDGEYISGIDKNILIQNLLHCAAIRPFGLKQTFW